MRGKQLGLVVLGSILAVLAIAAPTNASAMAPWTMHWRDGATLIVPVVSEISPSSGASDGAKSVTISGTGFVNVTAVHFGTEAASSFTVDSPVYAERTPSVQNADILKAEQGRFA